MFVLTEYPLQSLLKIFNFMGRIAKWGTQLGSFDIRYRSWNAVKGQVLADFVAEFSPKNDMEMVCYVENRSDANCAKASNSANCANSNFSLPATCFMALI